MKSMRFQKSQNLTKDVHQAKAFRKAAHELGADASNERFQDVLRTVAKAKPQPQPPKKSKRAQLGLCSSPVIWLSDE